jgi:hypothetical protein
MTLIGTNGFRTGTKACLLCNVNIFEQCSMSALRYVPSFVGAELKESYCMSLYLQKGNSLFSYCHYFGWVCSISIVALTLSSTSEVRPPATLLLLITGNGDLRIWNMQCHNVRTNIRWHPFCWSRVRTCSSVGTHRKERAADLIKVHEFLCKASRDFSLRPLHLQGKR